MQTELDIEAINYGYEHAVLSDGQVLKIETWIDDEGDESSKFDAVAGIAGPDKDGHWWSFECDSFHDVTIN